MNDWIHPQMRLWFELGELLFDAAEIAARSTGHLTRKRRRVSYRTRRPGVESPTWNLCADLLRAELKPYGSKVRLARFLGIPKQRLNDFLKAGERLPDAELTLLMLAWLAGRRAGRDHSL